MSKIVGYKIVSGYQEEQIAALREEMRGFQDLHAAAAAAVEAAEAARRTGLKKSVAMLPQPVERNFSLSQDAAFCISRSTMTGEVPQGIPFWVRPDFAARAEDSYYYLAATEREAARFAAMRTEDPRLKQLPKPSSLEEALGSASVEDKILVLLCDGWVLYGSPMSMPPQISRTGHYTSPLDRIGQAMVKHAAVLVADLLD